MNRKFNFGALFAEAERDEAYWVERAVLEFTEDVVGQLDAAGINRAELARRIEATPAYVSKILRGNTNFTLESMVRIAQALGCTLRMHLQPDGARSQWFDLVEAAPAQAGLFEDCAAMTHELSQYAKSDRPAGREQDHDVVALAS